MGWQLAIRTPCLRAYSNYTSFDKRGKEKKKEKKKENQQPEATCSILRKQLACQGTTSVSRDINGLEFSSGMSSLAKEINVLE